VLKFFDWAYKNGDGMAKSLSYVPLPEPVKAGIRKSWAANIKGPNGQPVYVAR
jgi:phosphate transport system substrate-binding protein